MSKKPNIPALSPDEFKSLMEEKGWGVIALAERWGVERRRVHQIIAEDDRNRYYDDALRGLAALPRQTDPMEPYAHLSSGEKKYVRRLLVESIPLEYKNVGWRPDRIIKGSVVQDFVNLMERKPPVVMVENAHLKLISK